MIDFDNHENLGPGKRCPDELGTRAASKACREKSDKSWRCDTPTCYKAKTSWLKKAR